MYVYKFVAACMSHPLLLSCCCWQHLFGKKTFHVICILDAILFPERMSHIIIYKIPLIWTETLNALWRWNTYYRKKLKITNTWYYSTLPSPPGSACVCGKHSTANIVGRLQSSITCGTGIITKIWVCSNLSTLQILHLWRPLLISFMWVYWVMKKV